MLYIVHFNKITYWNITVQSRAHIYGKENKQTKNKPQISNRHIARWVHVKSHETQTTEFDGQLIAPSMRQKKGSYIKCFRVLTLYR